MATKAVIEIPVDDAAFRRFIDLYHSYSASLEDMPDAWKAINEAMGEATEGLESGAVAGKEALALAAAQAGLIAEHLQVANKAQLAFKRSTDSHAREFVELGRAGSGAWRAIGGAADASISKVGSGIAGMASALGPVGLAAGAILTVVGAAGAALKGLSDAAVTRERSAFSKGITPGQEASFGVYGQQFMGAGALQAAANAQLNMGNTGPLSLLGIDFQKARGLTASDLAYQMLRGAVVGAQAHPELPLENIPAIQAYKRLGGDVGDVRNAMKMGLSALDASQAEEARNAGRLNLSRGAVAQAATFKKAVEGAGVAAQSFGINHLSGADPVLATIIGAITGDKTAQGTVSHALKSVSTTIQQHVAPALKAFENAVQGATRALTSPLTARAAAANALGSIEGTWGSVNSDSGALGRWQFMPSTADAHLGAAWVKKYGSTSTARGRAAFLGSPKAQTAAFNDFYDELYRDASKRTKDPKQIQRMIALGWYGGEGSWNETQAQLNAPQWYGGHQYPSQNSYADKFEGLVAAMVKATNAAQRNARSSKPAVKVNVRNSTASRVDVSANAAAQ